MLKNLIIIIISVTDEELYPMLSQRSQRLKMSDSVDKNDSAEAFAKITEKHLGLIILILINRQKFCI